VPFSRHAVGAVEIDSLLIQVPVVRIKIAVGILLRHETIVTAIFLDKIDKLGHRMLGGKHGNVREIIDPVFIAVVETGDQQFAVSLGAAAAATHADQVKPPELNREFKLGLVVAEIIIAVVGRCHKSPPLNQYWRTHNNFTLLTEDGQFVRGDCMVGQGCGRHGLICQVIGADGVVDSHFQPYLTGVEQVALQRLDRTQLNAVYAAGYHHILHLAIQPVLQRITVGGFIEQAGAHRIETVWQWRTCDIRQTTLEGDPVGHPAVPTP
jgi:hypothetical protein